MTVMSPSPDSGIDLARRTFLKDCGIGLGKMALAGLLADGLARLASRCRRPIRWR